MYEQSYETQLSTACFLSYEWIMEVMFHSLGGL